MLIPTYLLAYRNGELRPMWKGEKPRQMTEENASQSHRADVQTQSGGYTPLVESDDDEATEVSSPGLRGRSNGNTESTSIEMRSMATSESSV